MGVRVVVAYMRNKLALRTRLLNLNQSIGIDEDNTFQLKFSF